MTMQRKWTIGQHRFEIEWCSDMPCDAEAESCDPDRATYVCEYVESEVDAVAFARAVLRGEHGPLAVGQVFVREQVAELNDAILEHERLRCIDWRDERVAWLASAEDEVAWERPA